MIDRYRVLLLDTKECDPNYYMVLAIEDALKHHPSVEAVWTVGYDDALNVAIRNRCNLLFAFEGEGLDRGLCQRLIIMCGSSLLWVTDDPYARESNVHNARLFDLHFTNDSGSLPSYQGKAHHLPFAACPKLHEYDIPYQGGNYYLYDLLFVGTAWPNRVSLLKALLPDLKGLKVKFALPYNQDVPVPDIDLSPSAYLWRTTVQEMAKFANRSRIVLTLHRDYSVSGNNTRALTPGPRIFEAALAGGFQLVDGSLPEVSNYFHVGKEIAAFTSPDECVKQIEYYLSHEDERLDMARAAQKRCVSEHLYKHRIDKMFEMVNTVCARSGNKGSSHRSTSKRKIRVLHVAHNHVSVAGFGGVEVYVDMLSRSLPDEYESLVYYPNRLDPSNKEVVLVNVKTGEMRRHSFQHGFDPSALQCSEREIWFGNILHEERVDLVHVHHLLYHPWSLPLVGRTLGIPVVMTVADYFPVCSHYNLLDPSKQYCNIPQRPITTCDGCLHDQDGAAAGSQASRRSFVSTVLEYLDMIVFLSNAEREIVQSVYPALRKNPRVFVEGYPVVDKPPPLKVRSGREVLKVAVPGNFWQMKGGAVLCRVFGAMREDAVEFHVYGHILPDYLETLKTLDSPNVHIHGPYSPDVLHEKLSEADVSLHLSIWPETYVLTLSESWRAGLVPIVTDTGALGERVSHRVNGLKVPVGDAGSVVQLLRELMADRGELETMRRNIHQGLYRTLEEHIKILAGVYGQFIEAYRVQDRPDAFFREYPNPRPASAADIFRRDSIWLKKAPETRMPHGPNSGSGEQLLAIAPLADPFEEDTSGRDWMVMARRAKHYMAKHGVTALVARSIKKLIQVDRK